MFFYSAATQEYHTKAQDMAPHPVTSCRHRANLSCATYGCRAPHCNPQLTTHDNVLGLTNLVITSF